MNTKPGVNVLALCRQDHPPPLMDMIRAQATGTTVHGISLGAPLSVHLVPHCRHELLLSSHEDTFHFATVFGNRLNDLVGVEHEKLKEMKDGDQQMIVLRAVVMTGPNKAPSGSFKRQLVLLVKVSHPQTDVGFMPGLKMGVVFAEELLTAQHTWSPYIGVRHPNFFFPT